MKNEVTKLQTEEIEALANMRDEEIDTSDIPEVKDWSRAEIGKFYRPLKKPVTLRLDADVLAWLKSQGAGYQTRLNAILRQAMNKDPDAPAPRP
jgi:uncharacterized protein (DUF4415 family)